MEEKICRLCLRVVEKDFKSIGENTRKVFDVIQLKIDLSVTEHPLMCTECERNLKESYDFRSTCTHARNLIVSSANIRGGSPLDLRNVYPSKTQRGDTVCAGDYEVCQICIRYVKRDCCKSLDIIKENVTLEKNMIQKCLPEIDSVSILNPVICLTCSECLESYLTFVKACGEVEQKIRKYRNVERMTSKGQVQLSHILKRMFDDDSKVDPFENGETVENEINECLVKLEEEELHIKDEVQIDEEGHIFACFQAKKEPLMSEIDHASSEEHVSETTKHQCEECDYKAKRKYNLIEHTLTHKDSSEVPTYKCEQCGYETKFKRYITQHLRKHKEENKCEKCTFKTGYKSSLKIHMLTHRDSSEVAVYKCELCTYETIYKGRLKGHMLTHKNSSEVAMYKCEKCPFKSKYQYHFKLHSLLHKDSSEVKMYRCEQCAYETKFKSYIKRHKRHIK